MEGINISVSKVGALGDIALVRVKGYIDTTTSTTLWKSIHELVDEGIIQLIIELSGVQYVSSAGWGVFVGQIRDIRESGGDIKIVQMLPEVQDVFEMLEFNRILNCLDTVEEAMDDFDISRGLDISKSQWRSPEKVEFDEADVSVLHAATGASTATTSAPEAQHTGAFQRPQIDEARLPLAEKVKLAVLDNPVDGLMKVKKLLNTARFGYTKVGTLRLRSLMKELNLDSKEKRYRFYRSR